jgi:hypothetical protein
MHVPTRFMFVGGTLATKVILLYFGWTLLPTAVSLGLLAVLLIAGVTIAAWFRLTAIPESLT